jgi:hypothetical protein
MSRILYYLGTVNMIHALTTMEQRGCKFVVGGRTVKKAPATASAAPEKASQGPEEHFETLESMLPTITALPESIRVMFKGLDESSFRFDLSSTEIRKRMAGK